MADSKTVWSKPNLYNQIKICFGICTGQQICIFTYLLHLFTFMNHFICLTVEKTNVSDEQMFISLSRTNKFFIFLLKLKKEDSSLL